MGKPSVSQIMMEFIRRTPAVPIAYSLFMVTYPLSAVVIPIYVGKLLTFLGKSQGEMTDDVRKALYIIMGLYMIKLFLETFLDIVDNIVAPRFYTFIRTKMIEYVLDAYKRNYKHIEVGDVVFKIGNTPIAAIKTMYTMRMLLLPGIITIIGVCIYLFMVHWSIGLMFVITLLAFGLIYTTMITTCMKRMIAADQQQDEVMEDVSDTIENLINVYANGQSTAEIARLELKQKALQAKMTTALACSSAFKFLFTFLIESFFVCGILLLLWLIIHGYLNVDVMAPAALVLMRVQTLLFQLSSIVIPLVYEIAVLKKIQMYLDNLPKSDDHVHANVDDIVLTPVVVRAHNLTYIIPANDSNNMNIADNNEQPSQTILKDTNLVVRDQDKILVTGAIGSGKSTFIKVMMGLVTYEGSIQINNQEVRGMSRRTLAKYLFYMPQEAPFFNKSVYYNMSYGNGATRDEVNALFKRFNVTFTTLDTKAGKRGSRLSGGQRQTLYLIRAFLSKAPVLLLDEPTSSMDPKHKSSVMTMLAELTRTRTVLLISHDVSIDQSMFTRHIVFSNGQIVTDTQLRHE